MKKEYGVIPIASDRQEYLAAVLAALRPGGTDVRAFYEHRVGVICTDPDLMLMLWDDHLVHRGDGVFETMKFIGKKLYQLEAHLDRIRRSCRAIHLAPPCDWDRMREIAVEVARAAGTEDGMVRIMIGRGPGSFGIDPADCPVASLYLAAYDLHSRPEAAFEKGVTAFRSSIPAKQSYLASIKSIDYLPNVLMKREAAEKGYDYPLCFDEHGFLAEGATENVVIVDQSGELLIPEFTNALAGTTLLRAIDLVRGEIEVRYKKIQEHEILEAREVILVGTTNDALSVVRFNGKPIHNVQPGPVSRRLRELIRADIQAEGLPF